MTKTYNIKGIMDIVKKLNNAIDESRKKAFNAGRDILKRGTESEKYTQMIGAALDELEAASEKFYKFYGQYDEGSEADIMPSADAIADILIEIDKKLATCSSQEAAIGTTVKLDPTADNRYWSQWPPVKSLQFNAKLTRAGWVITSAYIADCMPKWERYLITFTPKTLAEMAEKMARPAYDDDDEKEED